MQPAIEAKPTWVLRDFHSPNLLWLPERRDIARVGLLDFQDAVMGPAAYDLASLLQDARVDVPEALEVALLGRYVRSRSEIDEDSTRASFIALYATLAAQRASKILGIFARLDRRDGKPQYLRHMPRVWRYLQRSLAHPSLAPLKAWYSANVPRVERVSRADRARMTTQSRNRTVPRTAMVLAAGLGERMRPLTDRMPKPLVAVGGKALIDHVLDRLADAGVERAVVNVHYLADQIERHLAGRKQPQIVISDEREKLLDTGGGVVKALGKLGTEPFFHVNSDTIWIDGVKPNLERLAERFDPASMDALLLLAPAATSIGYSGRGDFVMLPDGRLERRGEREVVPFVYAGAAILTPTLFAGAPEGAFSLTRLFDRAPEAGRLHGLRLEGVWMHVGTPEAIAEAEDAITAKRGVTSS